jgi:hypothetical protein
LLGGFDRLWTRRDRFGEVGRWHPADVDLVIEVAMIEQRRREQEYWVLVALGWGTRERALRRPSHLRGSTLRSRAGEPLSFDGGSSLNSRLWQVETISADHGGA